MCRYSIFYLLLAVGCVWYSSGNPAPSSKINYDQLVLAQFWPPASCEYFIMQGSHCDLPSTIKGWTIHGLWPSKRPPNCPPQKFDFHKIADLKDQLDVQWHFYNADAKDKQHLWKHEWEEHGICAYQLETFRGERNYFSQTLKLHKDLDTVKALSAHFVKPGRLYTKEKIMNALRAAYKTIPFIACDYDAEIGHYLTQVHLCYDLQLNLRDCGVSEYAQRHNASCPEKEILYRY